MSEFTVTLSTNVGQVWVLFKPTSSPLGPGAPTMVPGKCLGDWAPSLGHTGLDTWPWAPSLGHTGLGTQPWTHRLGHPGLDTWPWAPSLGHTALGTQAWTPGLGHSALDSVFVFSSKAFLSTHVSNLPLCGGRPMVGLRGLCYEVESEHKSLYSGTFWHVT